MDIEPRSGDSRSDNEESHAAAPSGLHDNLFVADHGLTPVANCFRRSAAYTKGVIPGSATSGNSTGVSQFS